MSGNDSRYADILRRIEQKKREQASIPKQSILAGVLDALNAVGFLDQIKKRPPSGINAYGPQVFGGSGDGQEWAGAVIWHKPKGYFHYQTLGLLGIWAVEGGGQAQVIIGEKALTFSAPIFNAESYYRHIKRRFDLYYPKDAAPPQQALYSVVYDPAQRLTQREAVEQTLRTWVVAHGQR